jgi:hypothetical protein
VVAGWLVVMSVNWSLQTLLTLLPRSAFVLCGAPCRNTSCHVTPGKATHITGTKVIV